jgi:hypothetical protein
LESQFIIKDQKEINCTLLKINKKQIYTIYLFIDWLGFFFLVWGGVGWGGVGVNAALIAEARRPSCVRRSTWSSLTQVN